MDEYIKLQKPLKETKYLSQENIYRYRPIMRFFFNKYEQADYSILLYLKKDTDSILYL